MAEVVTINSYVQAHLLDKLLLFHTRPPIKQAQAPNEIPTQLNHRPHSAVCQLLTKRKLGQRAASLSAQIVCDRFLVRYGRAPSAEIERLEATTRLSTDRAQWTCVAGDRSSGDEVRAIDGRRLAVAGWVGRSHERSFEVAR